MFWPRQPPLVKALRLTGLFLPPLNRICFLHPEPTWFRERASPPPVRPDGPPAVGPAVSVPHAAASPGLGDSIRGCSGTLWCHLADICPTSIAALRWCERAAIRLWFFLLFSLVQPHPPVFRVACVGISSPTALPTPFCLCPPSLSTPTAHLNTI